MENISIQALCTGIFLCLVQPLFSQALNLTPSYASNSCNSYSDARWNSPATTVNSNITTFEYNGVSTNCSMPFNFVYNLSGTYNVSAFHLENMVGNYADNGVKDFTVYFYNGLDATGDLSGQYSGTAQMLSGNTWQVFTFGQINNVKSFRFTVSSSYHPGGTISEFDEVGLTASIVLPVEMTSFTNQVEGHQVKLNWATASEKDNKGFFVETSLDGRTWTALGFVPGQGTSLEPVSYQFMDEKPDGVYYYRLKQEDFDGTTTHSEITTANIGNGRETQLNIWPNPSPAGIATLVVGTAEEEEGELQLISASNGRLVKKLACQTGAQEINLQGLAQGTYIVRYLGNNNQVAVTRFLVTR